MRAPLPARLAGVLLLVSPCRPLVAPAVRHAAPLRAQLDRASESKEELSLLLHRLAHALEHDLAAAATAAAGGAADAATAADPADAKRTKSDLTPS